MLKPITIIKVASIIFALMTIVPSVVITAMFHGLLGYQEAITTGWSEPLFLHVSLSLS